MAIQARRKDCKSDYGVLDGFDGVLMVYCHIYSLHCPRVTYFCYQGNTGRTCAVTVEIPIISTQPGAIHFPLDMWIYELLGVWVCGPKYGAYSLILLIVLYHFQVN